MKGKYKRKNKQKIIRKNRRNKKEKIKDKTKK